MAPYGQYASPYLGMGNSPVNGVDPDGGLFGLNAFYSKMVGIGLGPAVGGYIGKELIADKKDSRDSRVYAAIGGVIGGLIGGFAPELKASIGDGLRNLPNLGKILSDAGEVIGDVGELYASTRSGVAFFESAGKSDIIYPNCGLLDVTEKFYQQLIRTELFFTSAREIFDNADFMVPGDQKPEKLRFFASMVKKGPPFDIKQPGKGFSAGEIGRQAIFEGNVYDFDDFGNINFGYAARVLVFL